MLKLWKSTCEKGFTLIELLLVATIIGILLAIAIPNLIKARQSANEANARKAMQTLWDAEGEFFEQDLDDDGSRDYTNEVGTLSGGCADPAISCLRDPAGTGSEHDALIDSSFEGAISGTVGTPDCTDPKAGYCIQFDTTDPTIAVNITGTGFEDFGWQASMTSFNKIGRRDFAVYSDKSIKCTPSTQAIGAPGAFEANRTSPSCD